MDEDPLLTPSRGEQQEFLSSAFCAYLISGFFRALGTSGFLFSVLTIVPQGINIVILSIMTKYANEMYRIFYCPIKYFGILFLESS